MTIKNMIVAYVVKPVCNFLDIVYSAVVAFVKFVFSQFTEIHFVSSALFLAGVLFFYGASGLYEMIPGVLCMLSGIACAFISHKK